MKIMCSTEDHKKMRVSNDHWTTILEFSEIHKEIITNRFGTHFNGKQRNLELWKDLTTKLNSLGQGERSVEEWKKKLADWKSKTKAKAARIHKYIHGTGGGPANYVTLTNLEEKLLSLMGSAAAHGDKSVAEKGLKRKLNEIVEGKKDDIGPTNECIEGLAGPSNNDQSVKVWLYEKNQVVENVIIEEIIDEEIIQDHQYYAIGIDLTSADPKIVNEQQKPTSTKKNCSSNENEQTKTVPKNKKVDVNSMHEDVMTFLDNINSNICRIANSFEKLVDHFYQ